VAQAAWVSGGAGRSEGLGRALATAGDLGGDRLAIDGEGQGPAHTPIVEWGAAGVEAVEVGAEVGIASQEFGRVAEVGVDLAERSELGEVELAGAEGALLGVDAIDRVEVDRVEPHRGGVPVAGVFGRNDLLVRLPVLEGEGSVGDDAARARPAVAALVRGAVFLDRGQRDGQPGRVGDQGQEVRGGVLEGEAQGAGVEGGGADLGEVRIAALVKRLGALEDVEHVGVVGREGRREDAAEGRNEVLGRDRIAVGPPGVGPQEERVHAAFAGDLPTFGDPGDGVEIDGVLGDEALEEGAEHVALGDAGDEVRIEFGDLVADAAVQDLFAVAALDGGLSFQATRAAQRAEDGRQQQEEAAGRRHALAMSATAWAAMASPRPRSPTPSLVVAFKPRLLTGTWVDLARAAFISAMRG
jgi:hypothetical protein